MSADRPEQLRGLRRAGRVVAATLQALRAAVAPGVTTGELDALAERVFAAHGARSGPVLTYGYPAAICISVEDEVVHAIPARAFCGRASSSRSTSRPSSTATTPMPPRPSPSARSTSGVAVSSRRRAPRSGPVSARLKSERL